MAERTIIIDAPVSARGPLRMHFQHSGAKIRVFEQSIDIIKFWLFYSVIAHEYFIFCVFIFFLPMAMNKRFSFAMNHWFTY